MVLAASSPAAAALTFASTAGPLGGPDPVWTVAAQHGGRSDGTSRFDDILSNVPFGTAYHWGDEGGFPMIANTTNGNNGGIGNYIYFIFRQTFDLTGYDPSTVDLQFRWGCDDVPEAVGWTPGFSLNGGSGGLQGVGTCGAYALGGVVDLKGGFVNGINTLDFYVEGNGQTDGFELSTVSFTSTPVPEPTPLALLGFGLGALELSRRKRR